MVWKLYPNCQPQGPFTRDYSAFTQHTVHHPVYLIFSISYGHHELDVEPPPCRAQIGLVNYSQRVGQGKGPLTTSLFVTAKLGVCVPGFIRLGSRYSSVPRSMSLVDTKVTVGLDRLPRYVVPGIALRCNRSVKTQSVIKNGQVHYCMARSWRLQL